MGEWTPERDKDRKSRFEWSPYEEVPLPGPMRPLSAIIGEAQQGTLNEVMGEWTPRSGMRITDYNEWVKAKAQIAWVWRENNRMKPNRYCMQISRLEFQDLKAAQEEWQRRMEL